MSQVSDMNMSYHLAEGQIPGKRPEYLKPDDTGPKYKPDDKCEYCTLVTILQRCSSL